MYGYPDWTFVPEANITRGEAAAMFARLFKEYPGLDYDFKNITQTLKEHTGASRKYPIYQSLAYLAATATEHSDQTTRSQEPSLLRSPSHSKH